MYGRRKWFVRSQPNQGAHEIRKKQKGNRELAPTPPKKTTPHEKYER